MNGFSILVLLLCRRHTSSSSFRLFDAVHRIPVNDLLVHGLKQPVFRPRGFVLLGRQKRSIHDENEESVEDLAPSSSFVDSTRRSIWRQTVQIMTAAMFMGQPLPVSAGEVGARITRAVTTSDLGISVRTSVVKGAQTMDQLDGMWEKFSDRYGLGTERSKAGSRPVPKRIPELQPLQVSTAQAILDASDRIFISSVNGRITTKDLQDRIVNVAEKVRVSFERSGVNFSSGGDSSLSSSSSSSSQSRLAFETAPQFNYVVYSHFKAYSELVIERAIDFGPFKSQFERQLGDEVLSLILSSSSSSINGFSDSSKLERLRTALQAIDMFLRRWEEKGFVAMTERTAMEDDQINDWLDDIADLEFNIALDGDITLNAQILLQEQGLRLYPSFCRCAMLAVLNQVSPTDQKVSAMDYYMDTDYNSDPDKFEVKEVLLSLQLETL